MKLTLMSGYIKSNNHVYLQVTNNPTSLTVGLTDINDKRYNYLLKATISVYTNMTLTAYKRIRLSLSSLGYSMLLLEKK